MSDFDLGAAAQHLRSVLGTLPDPKNGLSKPVFDFLLKVTPMINVDLLIQDDRRGTLLAWREDAHGTGWHVPGGIIRYCERLETRIEAVARRELGATVQAEPFPCDIHQLVHTRGHFISLLYRCRLTGEPADPALIYKSGKPRHGMIGWIRGIPVDLYPAHRDYRRWLDDHPASR